MSVIDVLKREEGFRGGVYKDHLGFDTVGYGTKMPITEEEAELLLAYRLKQLSAGVKDRFSYLDISGSAWDVLDLMAYQMGVAGVAKFKNMLKALEDRDYEEAARQMLDSRWARQTPARAERMAELMRNAD